MSLIRSRLLEALDRPNISVRCPLVAQKSKENSRWHRDIEIQGHCACSMKRRCRMSRPRASGSACSKGRWIKSSWDAHYNEMMLAWEGRKEIDHVGEPSMYGGQVGTGIPRVEVFHTVPEPWCMPFGRCGIRE